MSLVSGGPWDREDLRGPRGREVQTAGRAVGTGRSTALADTLGPRCMYAPGGWRLRSYAELRDRVVAPLRGEWRHAPTGPEL